MPSSPWDGQHGRTTLSVACHHCHWEAHTVERCQSWHAIIALGQHTRPNDVGRDMPSQPLRSKHCRMTSGMACHHRLWVVETVERRRGWHDITTLGQHTRSDDVGLGMPSSPLVSTNGRTTSGVACHHRLWAAQTVERRRAWHEITALELHAPSNDVGRGMTSPPLYCMHGRKTSSVA